MKKLITICAVAGLILTVSGTAQATWYTFEFSEEDLWNHTPSADSRLYNQDAPRRHHTAWKGDVQTTDSTQPNQSEYQSTEGGGTNGWYQSATYDSWLSGGPKDNLGNDFGLCEVQLWGAGYSNSRLAWNERFRVNEGAGAWQILATPTGWSGNIIDNPWPDDGGTTTPNPEPPNAGTLDQYFISWNADTYANDRILYSSYGNGVDDYIFKFKVDIIGEYPTTLEANPDGNPFEDDDDLRIWFGGYVADYSGDEPLYLNEDGGWYTEGDTPAGWAVEGYDGVMTIPEPATMVMLVFGLVALLFGAGMRRCGK